MITVKLEDHCDVGSDIMFDPNNDVYYFHPVDVFLFVGDCHSSEFKFETLAEAREFKNWAFGILGERGGDYF